MCTVTFLPLGTSLVFTSNRDETLSRPLALAPALTQYNGKSLLYPKDPKAGGTWFAVSADGVIAVLLNGAFDRHIPTGDYRKSRGLVLLEIIADSAPHIYLRTYDLDRIEPFTLILFQSYASSHSLIEFRWDGQKKYFKDLDLDVPHIYSSATLYAPEVIHERETWFDEFLSSSDVKTPLSVRSFHASAGRGDTHNGLIMNRGGVLRTQCITQAVLSQGVIDFYHHDLIQDTEHLTTLPILSKV